MPKVPVLELVQEFCTSAAFEEEFEGFAKEYAESFQDSLECKSGEGEHPLEYYEAYRAYINKFEKKIADFIESVSFFIYTVIHFLPPFSSCIVIVGFVWCRMARLW